MTAVTGDPPDELLDYAGIVEAAAARGVTLTRSSLRAYRASNRMPPPDELPAPDRPRWRLSTITTWLDNRPGRGARTDLRAKSDTRDN